MEPERRVVETPDGLRLTIVDFDRSPGIPLLFVHGSFGHARVWDFVVRALAGRPASALDLMGHGESDHAASEARYGFDAFVADIGSAVTSMGTRPVLAGHSIGSAFAMFYAVAHPETLAGAVFMDIDPFPPVRHADHLNEAGSAPPKRYASIDKALARESRIAPNAATEVHEHLARHGYRREASEYVQRFDQGFLRAVRTWDARPVLPRVTIPALVLRGAESTVMSPEGYDDLLRGLPSARGRLIPGASHQLHLDRPADVAAAIDEFMAGLEVTKA
jgi:pimeloyl-ACP methyl ester carboxylesterase